MVKLSISLPNNTQITLEWEEAEAVDDVLGMMLRGLPGEASPVSAPAPVAPNGRNGTAEKSTDAAVEQTISPPPSNGAASRQPSNGSNGAPPSPPVPRPRPAPSAANVGSTTPMLAGTEPDDDGLDLERQSPQARQDYMAFCQSLNPMGDMRRVVVAAEAAGRFFGSEGVNANELGELFDLAGWRRANSFTQTLRNAARSKFGWLERIPGRSGRYAATDLGRSVTLAG